MKNAYTWRNVSILINSLWFCWLNCFVFCFLNSGLATCNPEALWMYLTAQHDWLNISSWIEEFEPNHSLCGQSKWPPLAASIIDQHTLCSGYMRNEILNKLARWVPLMCSTSFLSFWSQSQTVREVPVNQIFAACSFLYCVWYHCLKQHTSIGMFVFSLVLALSVLWEQ